MKVSQGLSGSRQDGRLRASFFPPDPLFSVPVLNCGTYFLFPIPPVLKKGDEMDKPKKPSGKKGSGGMQGLVRQTKTKEDKVFPRSNSQIQRGEKRSAGESESLNQQGT
eukprot:Hpha_TRINITY_DN13008_c0_g2::TRINITY_DN13008_c0_g2_i2::g.69084::m.69084